MMKAIFALREGRGEQQGRTDNIYYQSPATSGVYKITCTANKKIYVGSAINLRHRQKEHFASLRRNEHENPKLQNAWNKYGPDAFIYEVLELVLPMSLTAREQYWFNNLKPFGRKGFNIAHVAGSRLGVKHTPESNEKNRQAHLGREHTPEARATMGRKGRPSPNLGNKYNTATREQMSQSAVARWGKTYILTSPDGTEYITHNLAGFCQDHPGLHRSSLANVARGNKTHHHGWKVRYAVVDVEVVG